MDMRYSESQLMQAVLISYGTNVDHASEMTGVDRMTLQQIRSPDHPIMGKVQAIAKDIAEYCKLMQSFN